jgi:hypothetical protein
MYKLSLRWPTLTRKLQLGPSELRKKTSSAANQLQDIHKATAS